MEVCKEALTYKMKQIKARMRKRVENDPAFDTDLDYSIDDLCDIMTYSKIDYKGDELLQQWDNGYWYGLSTVLNNCFKPAKEMH